MSDTQQLEAVADRLHSAAIHLLRHLRQEDLKLGLGPAQLSALSVLVFGGPQTIGALARIEQVAAPTVSRLVDALAAAGLAELALVRSGPYTHEQGRAAALDLLAGRHPPEAIFSGGVLLTLGVLQALRERRASWPADIALVGYADARWAAALVPPLTAIEQPVEQLGEMAVSLLLQARQTRAIGQRVVLESRLVVRASHWRAPQPVGPPH